MGGWVHAMVCMCEGQWAGICSLPPPRGAWGQNSGCRALKWMPLPTEPSHRPDEGMFKPGSKPIKSNQKFSRVHNFCLHPDGLHPSKKLGIAVCTFNPIPEVAEAGGFLGLATQPVQWIGELQVQSETLSQNVIEENICHQLWSSRAQACAHINTNKQFFFLFSTVLVSPRLAVLLLFCFLGNRV